MKSTRATIAAIVAALLLGGRVAGAQERTSTAKLALINTLIGGSVAAVTAAIKQRPVGIAALNGSIGGLTVFAGKCMISRGGTAREWIGQETSAIGSSIIANAVSGRRPLERVAFVVGPVRFYRDTKRARTSVKLDLLQVGAATYLATSAGNSLDWELSLKHGTLVVHDPDAPNDMEIGGVVKTWHEDDFISQHEMIHVAQEQFMTTALEEPLEGWLLSKVPGGKTVHRYFELGILAPVWAWANAVTPRFDRPWEREAQALSHSC